MGEIAVGVHKLFFAIFKAVESFGVALPEQVQPVAKALKIAHGLGADDVGGQHALRAGSMAQQQRGAVGVGQAQIADAVHLHGQAFHRAKSVQQPGQVDAQNLPHAASARIADKEIFVVFPRVPVGQVLPDVVDIVHRFAEVSHLCLDVLRLAPVQHGGGEEQRQPFGGGFGNVFVVAVVDEVQLGEHRQPGVQQLANERRVRERRGAHQRGVGGKARHRGRDIGVGGVRQAQGAGFRPAGVAGVHTGNADAGVNAFGQPRAALAHAAQAHDQ